MPAVSDVNLTIKQGEFVFVIGSSGAGKSTLLKLMSGELSPTYGTVSINRLKITRMSRKSKWLRRYVGYVPQTSRLIRKKTIGENLMEAAVPKLTGPPVLELVRKSLRIVGLSGAESLYPVQLSRVDCRWAELACALINNPPILVLDELTANIDKDPLWDMAHLLEEFNQLGSTIVLATHDRDFVNILHKRVVTLVDGRVRADVPQGRYGDIP